MVIVRLTGGLGNQLFQYATGRGVAYRNKTTLKLDASPLENNAARSYRLRFFNIVAPLAMAKEVAQLQRSHLGAWGRIVRFLDRILYPSYRRSVFVERGDGFDPSIMRLRGDVYLIGYWQSHRYFDDIEHLIHAEFTPKPDPSPENLQTLQSISRTDSISLHVRRGDYAADPIISRTHGVLPLDYYHNAAATIAQRVENPHFFVFSDEIEWAQHNLKLPYPLTFVTHNDIKKDYEDLRLMSACKHHIVANSTFSWWGAWLGSQSDKIVVAPQRWFADSNRNTHDLLPDSWYRL